MTYSAPRKPSLVNKKSFTPFRTSLLSVFVASAIASPVFASEPVRVTEKNYENSQDLVFDTYKHYSSILNDGTNKGSGKYHTGVLVESTGSASLTGKNIIVDVKDLSGLKMLVTGSSNAPSLRAFQTEHASLKVGGSQTEQISISFAGKQVEEGTMVIGFLARGIEKAAENKQAGNLEVTAKTVKVNLDLGGETVGYGFLAQGNDSGSDLGPKISVNADTYIDTKGENAVAIAAFSSGKVQFNENLYVNLGSKPDTVRAIAARGYGSVVINPTGDKTVQIVGNIDFNFTAKTSNTPVDGRVEINLNGADSFWHGSSYLSVDKKVGILGEHKEDKLSHKHNLVLKLENGAVWNPTSVDVFEEVIPNGKPEDVEDPEKATYYGMYYAAANRLILNDGVVNVKNNNQPVIVQKLEGKGTINIEAAKTESGLTSGQFHVGDTELDGKKVEATQFNKAEEGTHLNVNFTGVTSDDINSEEFASLATNVKASGATQAQTVKEGLINGDWTQNVDKTGAVVTTSTAENTVNQSLRDIGAMTFLGFRTAINDLDKRLGDLRSYSGENGGWVRYLGGQHRYGDRNMKLNYNGFQAGFDHRFGEFYAGAAFGYTRGSGHLHNGSSDNNNWNFGLYGGWLGEKGQFVDVIVKRHRFKNEFNLHHTSGLLSGGSYHNWATSFSAEAGWRFSCPTTGFYAEPQAELSLGRMEKGSFTTNQGVKVKQNAINSTVGRLGVAAGYTLPEGKGNAYVKASVLHDWSAKVKGSMSKGNLKKSYRDDLGGTWAEFSVGGTYNATKNISAYGEFQTSAGSPVRSPWAASVGVRYNF